MFEDTLLIIKTDYMHKRKPLLIHLLKRGFQIKGRRKMLFTPELAAEFYKDQADNPCFMMFVIMLSKGNTEAFILDKENAVEDLLNTMVCYFGTSVEMDRNVHVTQCAIKVQREISFIFPNYIYEPILCPDQLKFCTTNPIIKPLFDELYDIVNEPEREPNKSWKRKLAEFFERTNRTLPHVSNMCTRKPCPHLQEQAQQTKESSFKHHRDGHAASGSGSFRSGDLSYTTAGSSLNVSSSSCLSCSQFGSGDVCIQQERRPAPLVDLIKAKAAPLTLSPPGSDREDKGGEECTEKQEKEWFDKELFDVEEEEAEEVIAIPPAADISETKIESKEIESNESLKPTLSSEEFEDNADERDETAENVAAVSEVPETVEDMGEVPAAEETLPAEEQVADIKREETPEETPETKPIKEEVEVKAEAAPPAEEPEQNEPVQAQPIQEEVKEEVKTEVKEEPAENTTPEPAVDTAEAPPPEEA